MEHDDNVDDVLESLVAEPDDFDTFLRRKAEACLTSDIPASQLRTTDLAESTPNVEGVEATSEQSENSTETVVIEAVGISPDAPVVDEKELELKLHKHQIIGSYIAEETVELKVDEEWKAMFVQSHAIAVQELTAEQVIERYHTLRRNVFLIKAQQGGLRLALEDLLAIRNAKDRSELLALDAKLFAQSQRKVKDKIKKARVTAGEKAVTSAKPSSTSKGKTKGQKGADTLKSLMMDKDGAITLLKTQGVYDEATAAYVMKLWGA